MPGTTIATTISNSVTLGYGGFYSPLSITSAGAIADAPGAGISITNLGAATINNSGTVTGSIDGIYLYASDATITNHGHIGGSSAGIKVKNFTAAEAQITNSSGGTIKGDAGIIGQYANVNNAGYIYGSDEGIRLLVSTIVNSGTIAGGTGVYATYGTLTNTGDIHGRSIGISISGAAAVNTGTISGELSTGARLQDEDGVSGTITGSLVNKGSISGGNYGVYDASGSFINEGALSGRIGLAVNIGGTATNESVIYGSAYGAELMGKQDMVGGASLINSGSITGGNVGVTLGTNGNLLNNGYIYGPNYGAVVYDGYLNNAGRILNASVGVTLSNGVVENSKTGTISAFTNGVAESAGLVSNYGTIEGGDSGAFITGGSLANFKVIEGSIYGVSDSAGAVANYGLISGSNYGIMVARGIIANAGTIAGGIDAIEGSFVTLAVQPGAQFVGQVDNINGKSMLAFAGAGIGTLGGIGSQIIGFKEISFAAGPEWSIEGNEAGLSQGTTIVGFNAGDTITLDGFTATSKTYVKGTGLELANGTSTVTLDITGNFNTASFQVTQNNGDTVIVTCFAAGTRIATPDGEIAVQCLRIGDKVSTLHGGAQPVKWIGRRNYEGRLIRGNAAVLPVRIKAGAIADGVPARDLRVSPGHAISIDEMLVHAGRLLNGVSVVQEAVVGTLTYYHIELENHEILLAENCPAESFMDEPFRQEFVNAADFARLYPGHVAASVICQPRLDCGFQLYAIQRRLRARAGLREQQITGKLCGYVDQAGPGVCFGWAQDLAAPGVPVSLDICADGRRIGRVLANLFRADVVEAGYGDGYQGFEFALPAGIAGTIEVRRSIDGTLLETAAGAMEQAA